MFKKQVTQVTQVTQNGGECRSQKGNSGSADEGTAEPDAAARHGGVREQRVRVGSDAGIHLVEPLGRHVVEVGHAAGRIGTDVALSAPAFEGHGADKGRQRQLEPAQGALQLLPSFGRPVGRYSRCLFVSLCLRPPSYSIIRTPCPLCLCVYPRYSPAT